MHAKLQTAFRQHRIRPTSPPIRRGIGSSALLQRPAPVADLNADAWNALNLDTRYYTTKLHAGCFALPRYVEEMFHE